MDELLIKIVVERNGVRVTINDREKKYRSAMSAYTDICYTVKKYLFNE